MSTLIGCGSSGSNGSVPSTNRPTFPIMVSMYREYAQEHGGKAPPNEQAYRDFLSTKKDRLQQAGITVDDFFKSPRGGAPLDWVYGRRVPTRNGVVLFASEREPVNGKRFAIAELGYQELDESEFRRLFPNAP